MAAQVFCHQSRVCSLYRRNIIAGISALRDLIRLLFGSLSLFTSAFVTNQGMNISPFIGDAFPFRAGAYRYNPSLNAAMRLFVSAIPSIHDRLRLLPRLYAGHVFDDPFIQRRLIPLYRQNIIRILLPDGFRNLLLTPHRVYAYDAFTHVQHLQKLRYRRDLIRFLLCPDLSQTKTVLLRPCADHMHLLLGSRPADRLPIYADLACSRLVMQRFCPCSVEFFYLLGLQHPQHSLIGRIGWRPVLHLDVLPQPFLPFLSEHHYPIDILHPTHDGT